MTLAEFRSRENLTLAALAERLGLPLTTVHGYLTGQRRPDPDRCRLIAEKTGGEVSAAELRPDLATLFRAPQTTQRATQDATPAPAPEAA